MRVSKKVLLIFLLSPLMLSPLMLSPLMQSAYAERDCQSNGLGGSLCVYDNGTISNSIPNGMDGQDTLFSDGRWSSTIQDGTGEVSTINSKGVLSTSDPDESGLKNPSDSDQDYINSINPLDSATSNNSQN